jgi:predicted DNA-binding WGR domain protein
MTAITLRRIDPAKNMRRFYRLDVQPDLFGQWCLIREWGRIGSAGQVRKILYDSEAAAVAALEWLQHGKQHRGYKPRLRLQIVA